MNTYDGPSPDDMIEIDDLEMTNFDHSISPGLAEALQAQPGIVYVGYPGWNFHARVWYWADSFWVRPMCNGMAYDAVSGESLDDVMQTMCERYGSG